MRGLSPESEQAFILTPKASLWPALVWALIHSVIAASVLVSGVPAYVKFVAIAGLLAHWLVNEPAAAPIVIGSRAGPWALPEFGLYNLRISPRTLCASWWVLLRLEGSGGRDKAVLILANQLAAADWRKLQIALREIDWRLSGQS